jgi:hypothetical protein
MVVTPDLDPASPTNAPCGSEEKIAVLTARAEAGLPLFLSGDTLTVIEPIRWTKQRGYRGGRYWLEH